MKTVSVRAGEGSYPVHIEEGLISRAGDLLRDRFPGTGVVVVADARVSKLHGASLRKSLRGAGVRTVAWIDVPPGEASKSLARARALYKKLAESPVDRWTPVVSFGGGVAGDLAGFTASTFMRGLPLVHVPTTVVAQADSAVGGKTAVNFGGAKNLIGTFHQPEMVLADPALLATLDGRDFRAGLAEAVKIGVTLRPDLMEAMERSPEAVLDRDPAVLTGIVTACVEAKAEVVARDVTDRDVRAVLNYGHTVGHALEAAARGRLRHGEAVAVGMNAAAWIGETLGVTDAEVPKRQNTLLSALGLKITRPGADNRAIVRNLKLDKKLRGRKNRLVLTLRIGGASVWPNISSKLLRDAVRIVTS